MSQWGRAGARGGREFVNDEGGGDASEWQPTCAAV